MFLDTNVMDALHPGDVSVRDIWILMDIAPVRLSKSPPRVNENIRYAVKDGHVEVRSGSFGMATIWDYDIVIMAVSHLTHRMNLFNSGKAAFPNRIFRPSVAQINKFCGRTKGGSQTERLEEALDRLHTTTIKVVRNRMDQPGIPIRQAQHESLISSYRTTSHPGSGKLIAAEIEIPRWLYEQVTRQDNAGVLQLQKEYFQIKSGIGRFLYRLARRAAGNDHAAWSFKLLHERSGSPSSLKKFSQNLRKAILANNLPEYDLQIIDGKDGEILAMQHRSWRASQEGTPPLELCKQLIDRGFSEQQAINEARRYAKKRPKLLTFHSS
jgi:plasmid replication initiation protein